MIDAHVHIWRLGRNGCTWPTPDLAAIHRDFGLPDVAAALAGTAVDRVMLVQSQESEADTAWLLAEAVAAPLVAGVVGWIAPSTADPAARLAALGAQGPLAGLRLMAQERPAGWLAAPGLRPLIGALADTARALDLLVRPHHLPDCLALADAFPDQRMVIDHGAKPPIATDGLRAWRDAIAPAAERRNLWCKLSGLITEAAPGAAMATLAPYVQAALDLFGPDRLIWGSDWPVITLNGSYRAWLDLAREIVPSRDHDAVFDGSARAFYGIAR